MSTPLFKRIVVGVDGHEGGRDALALAGVLQGTCGGELTALHAYGYDRSVALDDPPEAESELHQDLVGHLEREVARAGLSARSMVVTAASPARALHAIAERDRADLIVVGAPHRHGGARVLGGDVAAGTLDAAPCAVAVAPAGSAGRAPGLAVVGVGFDDSPESRRALALARRIARASAGSVRVYMVVSPAVPVWPGTATDPEWIDVEGSARERARIKLQAALADIGEDCTGHPIAGNPAEELTHRSGDLDLLVVGSRSYGPLRRLLLGSTSRRLIRQARCPVLVLPRSAPAQAPAGAARRRQIGAT
jgi:nucleotide-binding universal stress UspA family protein